MSAKATWPITMQIYQITMLYILNSQCCMSIISQKRGGGGDRKNGYFPTKVQTSFSVTGSHFIPAMPDGLTCKDAARLAAACPAVQFLCHPAL